MGADSLFGSEQPETSGADLLFGGEAEQSENRLKFVMDQAIDEKPDRAARSLEIQNRTGIPKKFIDDNFDELDKASRQSDFNSRDFMKSNPKVSDWVLRNPEYAPLVRDDIDTVGGLSAMFSATQKWMTSGESLLDRKSVV